MKTTNVLISLHEPIERARYLVRQVTNRVHHPESQFACDDADLWNTDAFMMKIMEAIFHFDKHELVPQPGERNYQFEACEDELLNVGVPSEHTAWIVNDVFGLVIDAIAFHVPMMAFTEAQNNQFEFINSCDVMVSSTCFLTPTPPSPWQHLQE